MAVGPVESWVERLGSIVVGRCMEYRVPGSMSKVAAGDKISQESRVRKAKLVDRARKEARAKSCTGTQQASWAESRQRSQ